MRNQQFYVSGKRPILRYGSLYARAGGYNHYNYDLRFLSVAVPVIPAAESRMYLRSRVRKRRGHDEIMEIIDEMEFERTNEENMRRFLRVSAAFYQNACFIKSRIPMTY